jgi:hypothetical protein
MLTPAVVPSLAAWRARKRRGLVIADSKAIKLPNGSRKHDPLLHLERGVLAVLHSAGWEVASECELLAALGAPSLEHACYADELARAALPSVCTADELALLAGKLASKCAARGVRCVELRCAALDEAGFNTRLASARVKSAVSFELVAQLIDRVRRSSAARRAAAGNGPPPVVYVDRQGGRTKYAGVLTEALGGAPVATLHESPACSAYRVSPEGGGGEIIVCCMTDAESAHLPVALASMTAKLVRELFMRRLNAFWGARVPELRPTAGYRPDGGRWLRDLVAAGFADAERLRRRA